MSINYRRHAKISLVTLFILGISVAFIINCSGSLGSSNNTGLQSPSPQSSQALTTSKITTGGDSTCYLSGQGKIYCWGANTYGALGRGDGLVVGSGGEAMADIEPVALPTGRYAVDMDFFATSACAVLDNGKIVCWGNAVVSYTTDNRLGLLPTSLGSLLPHVGNSPNEMGDNLKYVEGNLSDKFFVKVATGYTSACGLTDVGDVWCWGSNYAGQLGQGTSTKTSVDQLVRVDLGSDGNGNFTATKITAGYAYFCALIEQTNRTKCWGSDINKGLLPDSDSELNIGDASNELGNNMPYITIGTSDGTTPHTVKDISANNGTSCAILGNDTLKCWGRNPGSAGQDYLSNNKIGDNVFERGDYLSALTLPSGVTPKKAVAGTSLSCIISTDDFLYCMGESTHGQLDNTTGYTSMTQIEFGADSNGDPYKVKSVSLGSLHVCAEIIADTVKIKCWGNNGSGQLGIDSTETQGDNESINTQETNLVVLPTALTNE